MLILMAGLPGTGKSTLARELAERTGGHVLDKDVVRNAVFGPEHIEYSTAQDDVVLRMMLEGAAYLLERAPELRVFIDGRLFSRSHQVEEVVNFAEGMGTPWRILECVSSEETARKRLAADAEAGRHVAGNRTIDLYVKAKQRFEPISRPKTVIDTDQPLESCIQVGMEALHGG